MRAAETIFTVVCAGWWVATLVGQGTGPRVNLWRSRDVLFLLPAYRFFAPTPEFRDRLLEYRIEQAKDQPGPWQRLPIDVPRGWRAMLWYPHKLEPLFFELHSARLLAVAAEHGLATTAETRLYAVLLAYVRSRVPQVADKAIQFRVVTLQGYDGEAAIVPAFRSQWHQPAA